MQLTSFTPNKQFRLFLKVVTVRSIIDADRVMLSDEDGNVRPWEIATLHIHYRSGNLKGIKSERPEAREHKVTVAIRLADDVSEVAKRQGYARQQYLEAIEREGLSMRARSEPLDAVLEAVRRRLGQPRAPSVSTLKRWRAQVRSQGDDPAAFMPYFERRGGPGKQRMSPEVKQALNAVLDNFYLTTERYSIKLAYQVFEGGLLEKNKWRPKDQLLRIPSYSTFLRCLRRRPGFEVTAARLGAKHALSTFRSVAKNTEIYGLNECWEIDHTMLDLFVVDEVSGLVLGRPRLTMIIDHFSRAIMGFDVGFSGASSQAALDCLRHAILPKTYLRKDYPEVQGDWPCHGIPMVLKCDNGPEFHSHSFRQACFELGIDLQYCPVKEPRYKARIERLFRTFNESALTGLPGATGSHFYQRTKDSDPAAEALIDLRELRKRLHCWVVDFYMTRGHRGLE
ncbi:DDE-type integrase/transposase/recombinase [Variovorax atrisoli]|uniref:DDE-type integrase/transposase/recombinase n=1 Tax=Variovorax atrisoli TaxID=3394203 RepID=UPI000372EE14|nr:DDE-type integrase/transposase/recombinase [Variovorax paradoxus]